MGSAGGEGAAPASAFRVFFIPFFVPSHMIPMLDLACQFAARGVDSTLVVTPANGALVRRTVDRAGHPIRLLHHPFPSAEVGLPEGIENLSTAPPEEAHKIYDAVDAVRGDHDRILREHRPDAVVADVCYWWTTDIARELGIPRVAYQVVGAFPLVVMSRLVKHRPHASLPDGDNRPFTVPNLPDRVEMVRSELPNFLRDPMDRNPHAKNLDNLKRAQSECFGVVVNSFYELHPAYCDLFRQTECQRAWFCGPYTAWPRTEDDEEEDAAASKGDRSSWMAWLDEQATASVVYVGFGSFIYFTKQQHWEMARGLEASGRPFLWVLKESEFAGGGEGWLPEGFEERVRGRGMVVKGWVRQMAILTHRATGAFVTHLGWSSLNEGIMAGLPMITWPLAHDHFINERLVVDMLRLGVKMWGGFRSSLEEEAEKSPVSGEAIAAVVSRFAPPGSADEEVEAMRRRAGEYGDMLRAAVREGGSSYNDLGRLIHDLKAFRRQGGRS